MSTCWKQYGAITILAMSVQWMYPTAVKRLKIRQAGLKRHLDSPDGVGYYMKLMIEAIKRICDFCGFFVFTLIIIGFIVVVAFIGKSP